MGLYSFCSLLFLTTLSFSGGSPFIDTDRNLIATNDGHFEDDKIIILPSFSRQKRKYLNSARLWEVNGPLYYKIDGFQNETEHRMIDQAMKEMSDVTSLDFRPAEAWMSDENLHILFRKSVGCSSSIGRRFYSGPQAINTEASCFIGVGLIHHEMMHTLGFAHEHNRPDRDQYVTVIWENINTGFESQFEKLSTKEILTEPAEYDLGSVMHYRTSTFSKRDDLPVIRTINPDFQWTIGQRSELTFMDAKFINYLYCNSKCSANLQCQRGGYAHPKDCNRCVCPTGFSGQFCDQVKPGQNANCGGLMELEANKKPNVILSPNFPAQYDLDQQCSWLIRCPKGYRVSLDFSGTIDINCNTIRTMCLDYVEVRKGPNFANTGTRFCCDFYPKNGVISEGTEMLVLFRSFHYGRKSGFQANVQCF